MATRNGLTARSVVASTLLGAHPPVLPVAVLVRAGELFGISAGTVRVALSRMVAAGEAASEAGGRYRLTGALAERQRRQDLGRHAGSAKRWDGRWHVGVVIAERRAAGDRAALRTTMRHARFAELREGVWVRPTNLPSPDVGEDVAWMVAEGVPPEGLWDLDGWARRAQELLQDLRDAGALDGNASGTLRPAFELSAAVLRHLHADPLLPPELLPRRWPGDDLRAAFEAFDARFQAAWRAWARNSTHL